MTLAFATGRAFRFFCRATKPAISRPAVNRASARQFSSNPISKRIFSHNHGNTGRRILWASGNGAALGAAAFIELSEKDNGGTEQTAEMRMLEVSRKEIAKGVDKNDHGFSRVRHTVVYYLDVYLWEPLCTGFRFVHLFFIFTPVIAAVPIIWFGPRQKDRDNERSGTLWWYEFLVWSMERAGPAFIKVWLSWA
jgi:aarF domain-containing kinase